MSLDHLYTLVNIQAEAFDTIKNRIEAGKPSIIWAGKESGKTLISKRISQWFDGMEQIGIGYSPELFDEFLIDSDSYYHPAELPLTYNLFDDEAELGWYSMTPNTIVFIDNLFNIPEAEKFYKAVTSITPHVVAMGTSIKDAPAWPVSEYLDHYIGPYATWEMNPYFDKEKLREDRPKSKAARRKFNKELTVSVDQSAWADWKAK